MIYPQDFHNQIICSDCKNVALSIPDNQIDLIVTSPPYAEKRKKTYGGIPAPDYAQWLFDLSVEFLRILKPSGSLVVNIKEGASENTRELYVLEYLLKMAKQFLWIETFIWVKGNPFPTGSKKRLKDGFEYCFQFCKIKQYKFFPEKCLVKSTSKYLESEKLRKDRGKFSVTNGSGLSMSKRCGTNEFVRPSNVMVFPNSCLNIPHSAAFPLELPEFFIKLMTEENDSVFDPFMGSGTTAIACQRNHRIWIGSDIHQENVNFAIKRISSERSFDIFK